MAQTIRTAVDRRALEWVGLGLILLLAAYLRLGSPGIVEFKRDEANLSQLALELANGRSFPLLGIGSSVGLPNAPFNVYILSLAYLPGNDPQLATQFIGLLNVFAVGLAYYLGRHFGGPLAGLLAALLFAVNPWSVIFSRKLWAQNMLPFFVLLTINAGLIGFIKGRRWGQLALLPLLAITGQIHYGAFVILPASIYMIWHGRKRLAWQPILAGLLLALLLTTPYIIGVIRAGLHHPDALREFTAGDGASAELNITGEALRSMALTVAGTEIHSLAGPEAFRDFLASVPDGYPLFGLLIWAVLFSALWLLARCFIRRDARTPVDVTLLLWLLAPPLAFSVTWTAFHVHYLIPAIPAAFLILGFAAQDLWLGLDRRVSLRRVVLATSGAVLVVILFLQVWMWMALLNFVDTRATPEGFGTPLHYLLDVRAAILLQEPDQVVARLDGQAVGFDDEATIWNALLDEIPTVRFEDTFTSVYPSKSVLYLTYQADCSGEGQQFLLRPGEGCYTLGSRSSADFDAADFEPIDRDKHPVYFVNGIELVSYQWQDSEQTCLSIAWEITARTTEDYLFAIHFYNAGGERIAQADGLSWLGRFWRPDDVVVRTFCQTGLDMAVSVHIGMYTYDGQNFNNAELLDNEGTPVGHFVELPLR
jgi:hypothetical protein